MNATHALAVESLKLDAITRESLTILADAEAAVRATLTPEQTELFNAYENAMSDHQGHAGELHVAELARHLPGLSPAISALSAHFWESGQRGRCCEPAS